VTAAASLLEEIVEASGLSPIFARAAIVRALRRAGVSEEHLTRASARRALFEIRRGIEPFLQGDTDAVMQRIERTLA
jgi:hypothetical protein